MASKPNLRKYSYTATAASKTTADAPSNMSEPKQTEMDMKTEILSSLKKEIAGLFQTELKSALASEFGVIRSELQEVKAAIANNTAALRADLEKVSTTVSDMERGLSACSDDVTSLQHTVQKLERNVESLQEKCLDMECRMRRSNIRILNVAEETGSSSPTFVSKLIKDILKMDKDVLIDRSQRYPDVGSRGASRGISSRYKDVLLRGFHLFGNSQFHHNRREYTQSRCLRGCS